MCDIVYTKLVFESRSTTWNCTYKEEADNHYKNRRNVSDLLSLETAMLCKIKVDAQQLHSNCLRSCTPIYSMIM